MPPRRRSGRAAAITISVTSILFIGAVIAAWQLGWMCADHPATAQPTATGLPVETQMECTSIRREYTAWNNNMPRLSMMVKASNPADVVRFELNNLKTDGDALYKAVKGYPDQPAKALTVAVAQYNVDLNFVILEQQLTGAFSEDKKQAAVHSAGAVQTAYKTFMQRTCGEQG